MAGSIKGITIEFDGNTVKLASALRNISNEANSANKALKDVNYALKFNPGNVELLAQKQTILRKKVDDSKNALNKLRDAQKELDAKGVDKTSEEYMKLRREIITTTSRIKANNAELLKTTAALSPLGQAGTKMTALGKSATTLSGKMKGTSAAAAVLAAGIGLLAYKAGAAADDLNTMSHQYGINTKDLQNYQSTADLVDVSVETLAKTHVKLKKNMLTASQSASGSAAQAFDKLGVKVTGSNGELRDGNAVYDECINKLAGMKNETERDAYAMQIFGKSAADLNPMLEGGAEQYRKFTQLMAQNNLGPISQSSLDKANKFNDAIDTIKATFSRASQIIGTKVAGYLAPKMESLANMFAKIAGKIAGMDGKTLSLVGGIASLVAMAAPAVLIFGKLSSGIGSALTSISLLVTKVPMLGRALGVLTANPILLVIAALVALAVVINQTGLTAEQITAKIESGVNAFVNNLPAIIAGVVAALTTIGTAIPQLIPVIVGGFTTLLTALVQALPVILPALINGFTELIIQVANMLPTLTPQLLAAAIILFMAFVKAVPKIAVALWKALPQIIKAFKSGLADQLPKLWESIKNTAVGKFISMVAKIASTVGNVYDKIASPFRKALNFIKRVVDKIEGFFKGMKIEFPKIKLPHFKLEGKFSLKNMTVPHLAVNWYKNGGIFTKPTLLGQNSGVGDGGDEAALPLSNLWDQMDKQNSALISALLGAMTIDYDKLADAVTGGMSNMTVSLDHRQMGKLIRKERAL